MAAALNWDPVNLIFYETGVAADGNTEWSVQADFYQAWKDHELTLTNQGRAEFPRFMRYEGASPITDIQDTGSTFFMMGGWKFQAGSWDHEVLIDGNLWPDPFQNDLYLPTPGYTVLIKLKVSNLVDASVARLDVNQLLQGIYFDATNGSAGTGTDNGTPTNPTNNNNDLFVLLADRNLSTVFVNGAFTLDRASPDMSFIGLGNHLSNNFALGGYDVDGCLFERVNLSGTMNGTVEAVRCGLNVLTGIDGIFERCGLIDDFSIAANANVSFWDCKSEIAGSGTVELTMAAASIVQFRNYSGGLEVRNFVTGNLASFDMDPGHLIINADCTGGSLVLRGHGNHTDNSTGTTITEDGFVHGGLRKYAVLGENRDLIQELES